LTSTLQAGPIIILLLFLLLLLLGAVGAMLGATPIFSIMIAPLTWVYLKVMNYFRAVTRELKRLDARSRSPIYSHFSEVRRRE